MRRLVVICHDDSNGFYLFRHVHSDDGFSVGSEYTDAGLAVHGDVDRVTVAPDQNAVSLGITKVYGRSLRYLDLLYGHRLAPLRPGPARRRTAPRPDAMAPAPDDLLGLYNRACAHAKRRDRDAMLADLRAVLAVQPEDAEDAAIDDDLVRYRSDPALIALITEARTRSGRPHLPMGLQLDVNATADEAYAVVAAPPDGVVLLRVAYYPYGAARLETLKTVAPPDAITPDACAAYAGRLAFEIAKHPDLTVSVVAPDRERSRYTVPWRHRSAWFDRGPPGLLRAMVEGRPRRMR